MYCGVPMAEPIRVAAVPLSSIGFDCGSGLLRLRLQFGLADLLGQAPIDDQRLAEFAEHDVARLQIAVHDPAAMGIFDRVANVDKSAQQLANSSVRSPGSRGPVSMS